MEADQSRYTENLQVQIRKLDPGRYVLRMRAADRGGSQGVKRDIEFEVAK